MTTRRKFPKEVKAIYIAGKDDSAKSAEPEGKGYRRAGSRALRGWDREIRAMSLAAAEYHKTYAKLHDASNQETRNGALKHFAKNSLKAQKASYEVLRDNSKVFDHDPTEIYDNLVEQLEDLEDEYEAEVEDEK